MITRALAFAALLTGGLASCRESPVRARQPVAPVKPVVPASGEMTRAVEVINNLALIARGAELTGPERAALLSGDEKGARSFIHRMAIEDPRVARNAVVVLFPWSLPIADELELISALDTVKLASGRTLYYYRGSPTGPAPKPCTQESEAVEVTPWWDMSTKILVCKTAYQPDRLIHTEGRAQRVCSPEFPDCGCGPYMMLCSPSNEARVDMRKSLRSEFADTVVELIRKRRQLRDLFIENATFRDRRAELWQRRARVVNGERPEDVFKDIAQWPEAGKWAPRIEIVPGQQAGLLTTPHMFWQDTGPRVQIQLLEQSLWCTTNRSVKVSAAELFDIKTPDFRFVHDEGMQLAVKPVCETCHARLDQAMPFFVDMHRYVFVKPPTIGKAKVYFADSRDFRGEGTALPGSFAHIATSMPEFGQCMTKRVVEHVFGASASSEDYQSVHSAFESKGDYGSLMAVALERMFERRMHETSQVASTPLKLPQLLDQHCTSCHFDGADNGVDLTVKNLEPPMIMRALDEVSAQRMPQGFPPISADERMQVIDALIAAWPEPAEREGLARSFKGDALAPRVMRFETVEQAIHERVGIHDKEESAPVPAPYAFMSRRYSSLTPDLAIFGATQSVKACKKHGAHDLKQCAIEALRGLLFER